MSYYDSEMESALGGFENAFSEKAVRMGFIRKVYGILMVQLAITCSFIAMFLYVHEVKVYAMNNMWLFWTAFAMMIVLMIALICCEGVRRTFPTNLICLFLFTIAESFLLGISASTYEADEVMIAVGICAAICLALTLYAFQTKFDFTTMGGCLMVVLLIFMIFGFICIFIPGSKILGLVYASIGALIFSLYLVYDTQLLIGGNHKLSISPEEYVFAALNIYLDIVNMFIYILQIVSAARN